MGQVVVDKEAWALEEKVWAAADEQEVGALVAKAVQADNDVVEGAELVWQAPRFLQSSCQGSSIGPRCAACSSCSEVLQELGRVKRIC